MKTASKGYPKKFLNDLGWPSTALRGDTLTVKYTYTWNSTEKEVYGHAWNEPGTAGAPKKCLISSWNHTLGVDDHVKLRWTLNDSTGEGETITRTVPRTQMIKSYFEGACCIDVHNHLRQGSLGMEDSVGTNDWWFRCFCTVLGFIEVDAFKAYCHFNEHLNVPLHKNLVDNLVIHLLTNRRHGAPAQIQPVVPVRKRRRESIEDDELSDGVESHDILPYSQYIAEVRQKGSLSTHQKIHGSAARCKVCPKPAPPASYVCVRCSNKNKCKPFAVCGPKSGRSCIQLHQMEMQSSQF